MFCCTKGFFVKDIGLGLGLWYLTPFSTILQLYRDGSVLLVVETGVPGENH
jgi:hypothetical protein